MTHDKLRKLLNEMSLDEKIGQLSIMQMSVFLDGDAVPFGPLIEMNFTQEQMALTGALACNISPEPAAFARVVRKMTAEHPHHIPPLLMRDVIHGFRTIFPLTLGVGCTFDEKYAYDMGRVSGKEAAASGLHLTLGPMMDVARDPRWGRVLETPSESPVLTGAMSAATVRGFRGDGIDKPNSIATCAKHFAAYGLCTAGQEYSPVDVSRTELYNVYLPPFKQAMDAGCDTVMTSFVAVDRVPCVCNGFLQNEIMRKQWGHNIVSMSDYDDVRQLMNQGVADSLRECAKLSIEGGLDLDFLSLAYITQLKGLIEDGEVDIKTVDEACMRVLELKNNLGLFENPIKNDDPVLADKICHAPEHYKASLETALRSCVLLKNDGVLPLKKGVKTALVGSHADEHDILGAWAVDGIRPETETLREAFERDAGITLTDTDNADIIVFATGETKPDTGEAASKAHPELTAEQINELKTLEATGKPIVVLLFCGRPLVLTDVLPHCNALLNVWFPGSAGAEAIRMLVTGEMSPSGHLSMTFPRCVGQIPIHHDRLTSCRPIGSRGTGSRFVNMYIDESSEPLFPFGFGMSYTTFELEDAQLDGSEVAVTVKNTGTEKAETVVQLYGRVRHAAIIRPIRTLVGWKRVSVGAGEAVRVRIPIKRDALELADCENRPVKISGIADIYVGFDSNADTRLEYSLNQ